MVVLSRSSAFMASPEGRRAYGRTMSILPGLRVYEACSGGRAYGRTKPPFRQEPQKTVGFREGLGGLEESLGPSCIIRPGAIRMGPDGTDGPNVCLRPLADLKGRLWRIPHTDIGDPTIGC